MGAFVDREDDLADRLAEAVALIERGELRREQILVRDGIGLLFDIAGSLPPDHPERAHVFSLRGAGLLRLFDLTGNAAVLDDAMNDLGEALALTDAADDMLAGRTFNSADTHLTRYDLTGRRHDLDAAISLLKGLTPDDSDDQAEFLIALGGALTRRFEREGTVDSLDEASTCLADAIRLGPAPTWLVTAIAGLAAVAAYRARLINDSAPIDKVIALLREKITQPRAQGPEYECYLGSLLLDRHRLLNDSDALIEGQALLRRGLAELDRTALSRPAFLARLAMSLPPGATADAEEAVSLLREAVRTAPPRDRYAGRYRANLVKMLLADLQNAEALDEAIDLLGQAVADDPADPANAGLRLQLADALRERFTLSVQEADLSRAIALFEELRHSADPADPRHAFYLSRLGDALVVKFIDLGDVSALHRAVAVRRVTLEVASESDPNICSYHERLGEALLHSGRQGGQEATLASAVDALRTAVTVADDVQRPTILGTLGVALAELSKHGDASLRIERLTEAADVFREAARMTDPATRSHRGFLSDLADVLYFLAEATGRVDPLEDAIRIRHQLGRSFADGIDPRGQAANRAQLAFLQKHRADRAANKSEAAGPGSPTSADEGEDRRPRVFVSYSSEDRAFARRLQRGLTRAPRVLSFFSMSCTWSSANACGRSSKPSVISQAVVIVVSPSSIASVGEPRVRDRHGARDPCPARLPAGRVRPPAPKHARLRPAHPGLPPSRRVPPVPPAARRRHLCDRYACGLPHREGGDRRRSPPGGSRRRPVRSVPAGCSHPVLADRRPRLGDRRRHERLQPNVDRRILSRRLPRHHLVLGHGRHRAQPARNARSARRPRGQRSRVPPWSSSRTRSITSRSREACSNPGLRYRIQQYLTATRVARRPNPWRRFCRCPFSNSSSIRTRPCRPRSLPDDTPECSPKIQRSNGPDEAQVRQA